MTASIPINRARIIGAVAQPRSKAAFSRGALIVASEDAIARVQRYDHAGDVHGPALSVEEVRGLIESGHAIEVPGRLPLTAGGALWVLRRGFPRRDAALADVNASGCLMHDIMAGPDGAWLCLVDETGAAASALRDRWQGEAMAAARAHGREGRWSQAEAEAEAAFTVARALDPTVMAMLSLAHEKTGREQRARGLFEMARRSRGDAFVDEMRAAGELLRREVASPPGRALRHTLVHRSFGRKFVDDFVPARLANAA